MTWAWLKMLPSGHVFLTVFFFLIIAATSEWQVITVNLWRVQVDNAPSWDHWLSLIDHSHNHVICKVQLSMQSSSISSQFCFATFTFTSISITFCWRVKLNTIYKKTLNGLRVWADLPTVPVLLYFFHFLKQNMAICFSPLLFHFFIFTLYVMET